MWDRGPRFPDAYPPPSATPPQTPQDETRERLPSSLLPVCPRQAPSPNPTKLFLERVTRVERLVRAGTWVARGHSPSLGAAGLRVILFRGGPKFQVWVEGLVSTGEAFVILERVPAVGGVLLFLAFRLRARVGVPHAAHEEGQARAVLEDEEEEGAVHDEGGQGHAGHGRAGCRGRLHAGLAELQRRLMLHAGHHQPLVGDPAQVRGLE